jgi:hypothetical protein
MRLFSNQLNNEMGSVLVVALLMLVFLTIIGISVTTTTDIEIQIAGNERFHKTAFFAAEAARGYVPGNTWLYDGSNLDPTGPGKDLPNASDPSEKYSLGSKQSFKGNVKYIGFSAAPRESGYEVGDYKAHNYYMTCYGYYGPANLNAESQIEAGFYRIGF